MPTELEQIEEGIRRADKAGDAEAVRRLGRRWLELKGKSSQAGSNEPASKAGSGGASATLQDFAAGPTIALAPTARRAFDRMVEESIKTAPTMNHIIGMLLTLPAQTAHNLPVDRAFGVQAERPLIPFMPSLEPPSMAETTFMPGHATATPEQIEERVRAGTEAVFDASALQGGGKVGSAAAAAGEVVLKSGARGMRSIPEATNVMREGRRRIEQGLDVPDPRTLLQVLVSEGAKRVGPVSGIAGLGAGALADEIVPGSGLVVGSLLGGSGFLVTSLLRIPAASRQLLVNNRRFAEWALQYGGSGPARTAGAAVGVGAVVGAGETAETVMEAGERAREAGEWTIEEVREFIDMMREAPPDVGEAMLQFVDQMALTWQEFRRNRGEQ